MSNNTKNIIFNTDDAEVVEVTMAEVRDWLECDKGGDLFSSDLDTAIDTAQGEIHQGNKKVAYVVIKITK